MKAEKITIANDEYLLIDLENIHQKSQSFFVGKVLAADLLKLYTVRPTDYDAVKRASFAQAFGSDENYYSYLVSEVGNVEKPKDFQRRFDSKRVKDIAKFIEEEDHPFFPNTIIANCELINDMEEFSLDENSSLEDFEKAENKPNHLSFLFCGENQYKLLIPYRSSSILVIDGQHRLKGLEQCSQSITENFDLLVSFIVGFDRSVIAQQFYTINYQQKPVNKSLLYHLTGEFSTELDDLTFMHQLVILLNELDNSPFYQRIKMLGTNPPELSREQKDKLSISQAFLIDYLLKFISVRALSSKDLPIFLHYYQNEEFHIEIVRFIIKYFAAIRSVHSDWDNPNTSLISKGMGVGAFIRVLHHIFPVIFVRDWDKDPNKIREVEVEDIVAVIGGIDSVDFSRTGAFGGVGSAGSINKIKEQILESIGYTDQGDEWSIFKQWLLDNTDRSK